MNNLLFPSITFCRRIIPYGGLVPGESLEEQVQSAVKAVQMDCVKYYYLEYMGKLKSGGISIIVFTGGRGE